MDGLITAAIIYFSIGFVLTVIDAWAEENTSMWQSIILYHLWIIFVIPACANLIGTKLRGKNK